MKKNICVCFLFLGVVAGPVHSQEPGQKKEQLVKIKDALLPCMARVEIYLPTQIKELEDYLQTKDEEYYYGRFSDGDSSSDSGYDPNLSFKSRFGNTLEDMVRKRKPIVVQGVVVSENGEMVIPDPLIPLVAYKKIKVSFLDGRSYEAQLTAVSKRFPAVFVQLKKLTKKIPYVRFVDPPVMEFGSSYRIATLSRQDNEWAFTLGDGTIKTTITKKNSGFGIVFYSAGSLLLTREGKPFGMAFSSFQWSQDKHKSWSGKQLVTGPKQPVDKIKISADDLLKKARALSLIHI